MGLCTNCTGRNFRPNLHIPLSILQAPSGFEYLIDICRLFYIFYKTSIKDLSTVNSLFFIPAYHLNISKVETLNEIVDIDDIQFTIWGKTGKDAK